jgi:hypothetical protein
MPVAHSKNGMSVHELLPMARMLIAIESFCELIAEHNSCARLRS